MYTNIISFSIFSNIEYNYMQQHIIITSSHGITVEERSWQIPLFYGIFIHCFIYMLLIVITYDRYNWFKKKTLYSLDKIHIWWKVQTFIFHFVVERSGKKRGKQRDAEALGVVSFHGNSGVWKRLVGLHRACGV